MANTNCCPKSITIITHTDTKNNNLESGLFD